jgi:ribosomal protein RSM22 (predicted rRNA methylase)
MQKNLGVFARNASSSAAVGLPTAMLSRLPLPRLCCSCRNDLLAVFDLVPGKSPKPRAFLLPSLKSSQQTNSTRQFSHSRPCRRDVQDTDPASTTPKYEDAILSERTLSQNEGAPREIQEPETLVEGNQLGQSSRDNASGELATGWLEENTTNGSRPSSVATLRLSGANTESVVREARQLFGESLPEDVLNKEEFKLYRRLYDDPIEETVEILGDVLDPAEAGTRDPGKVMELLHDDGEPLNYSHGNGGEQGITSDDVRNSELRSTTSIPPEARSEVAPEQHESSDVVQYALMNDQVQKIAEELGGEVYDADEADPPDWDQDPSDRRAHPLTNLGRFATHPRTVYLPREAVIKPVEQLLSDYSNKHLKDVCERTFGGGGLPNSPLTPRSGRMMPQVPVPLQASQHSMGEMEANAFMTVIMPSTYAAINSVLVEIRKRLGTSWLNSLLAEEGGPRILDAGAGGAGIVAWRDIVRAEWEALHSSGRHAQPAPVGKAIVLTGSDTLRHRSAALLENTTFIPRLPDYVHIRDTPTLEDDRPASQRKEFDIIIASHTLWPFKEDWERKQHVQNLWSLLNPNGGVLILIEKGVPRGFEAIAGARELLLERHIASPDSQTYDNTLDSPLSDEAAQTQKGKGMIIAPCTNHNRCPMYPVAGMSRGRKDYCSFQQRYIRPQYLQRILGAKDRSHDDVDFSYISVLKGRDLREQTPVSFENLEDPSSAPQTLTSTRLTPDQTTDQAFEGFEHVEIPAEVDSDGIQATQTTRSAEWLPSLRDMPRLVYPPLKRRGHVTLDVCTPVGKIERWTVPKSYSKQAYRDARKSNWGDLWALGAKSRVARNLRLGGPGTKEGMKVRKQKNRVLEKAAELAERMEEEKLADLEEVEALERDLQSGFDDMANLNRETKRRSPQAIKKQAVLEDEHDEHEDIEVARALAEWEEEFEHDKRVGRKSVRSVREGTKVKRSTPRVAPVWHGRRDTDRE